MYKMKQSPILKSKLLIIRVAFLIIMLAVVLYAADAAATQATTNIEAQPIFIEGATSE